MNPQGKPFKAWLITDTHFNHKMLIDEGHRPKDYEEQFIKNWKKKVGKRDLVFHLGDVIWSKAGDLKNIFSELLGNKILIKGNHDTKKNTWYEDAGFGAVIEGRGVVDNVEVKDYEIVLSHEPTEITEKQINIHGHFHHPSIEGRPEYANFKKIYTDRHFCVSHEDLGFTPILLDEILNKIPCLKR